MVGMLLPSGVKFRMERGIVLSCACVRACVCVCMFCLFFTMLRTGRVVLRASALPLKAHPAAGAQACGRRRVFFHA